MKTEYALTNYGLICCRGQAAKAFLQGQLSADLDQLSDRQALLACYCNIKGRIQSICRLFLYQSDIYLILPLTLRDQLIQELNKYARFSKVSIMASEFGILGIISNDAHPTTSVVGNYPVCLDKTYALPRILIENQRALQIVPQPSASADAAADMNAWSLMEIQDNIPEIYPETYEKFLPGNLRLIELGAINFDKGCYRGQEIIARMHYRSEIKKTLKLIRVHKDDDNIHSLAVGTDFNGQTIVRMADDAEDSVLLVQAAITR